MYMSVVSPGMGMSVTPKSPMFVVVPNDTVSLPINPLTVMPMEFEPDIGDSV
jgi:hypothetical protein